MIDKKWLELIDTAKSRSLSHEEVIRLTIALSESGKIETFRDFKTYDIASTGGPSSLSTLLCPLFLSASGCYVPKLGVPGRPAGGIDVLTQIPDYTTDLNSTKLRYILQSANYAHFISNDIYAPLDAETFDYRKSSGAQAIPELAIASLLSKKIAVDVQNIGLDVRVSLHGNVGSNYESARLFARKFVAIAERFGRSAKCFLTDASVPFQPYIGRGEALVALDDIFSDRGGNWLKGHVQLCKTMADSLVGHNSDIPVEGLLKAFKKNLNAQGANYSSFAKVADLVRNQPRLGIYAVEDGYIQYDLATIRSYITHQQLQQKSTASFSDPLGMELLIHPNSPVNKGQRVISVRTAGTTQLDRASLEKHTFFSVSSDKKLQRRTVIVDE